MDIFTEEFLSRVVFENTMQQWLFAAGVFVAILLGLMVLKQFVFARIRSLVKKTSTKLDDAAFGFINDIGFGFFFVIALYAAIQNLVLPEIVVFVIEAIFLILIIHEAIKVVEKLVKFAILLRLRKHGGQTSGDQKVSSVISISIKILLWIIGGVLILSNLGFNVNSLIASLGIGGLAVSLALQNVLSDLFSSFSIALDKPFEEGDFIVVGSDKGTVKKIGVKTTRLTSLQGEEIVIANAELTAARVQNFKKMQERRVVFGFGVTYDTPPEKLRGIPETVKNIIEGCEHTRFDRAHFQKFDDSSLTYEVVYYTKTGDYNIFMDTQEKINLEILEAFNAAGIEMAFPTRTLYMKKEG